MEVFETRLFDLLETRSFEELNAEELAFVLNHLTEHEYRLQQQIMTESKELEFVVPEPLPLVAPKAKVFFLKRSIPLYQALLAAGCIALFFLVFRPEANTKAVYSASNAIDTVSVPAPSIIIPDTVTRFVEILKYQEKLVRDTIYLVQSVAASQRETRMLEATNAVFYPSASTIFTSNVSVPLSEDRTADLIPKAVSSGAFSTGR